MKSKTLKIWLIRLGLLALPFIAGAQALETVIDKIMSILSSIITILFVLVTVYFLWGVIQYVMAGGKEDQIKQGRDHMVWGVIGMAVMAAAWGIVKILINYFGLGGGRIPYYPGQL